MNNQMLEAYGLNASEYYEALRQVVDVRYQDAPYRELDAAVNPAIQRMSSEERDEFFGALAGIAAPFVGKAVKWGAGKIGNAIRRKVRQRLRPRRVNGGRSRVSHLMKMLNDPRLKRLLAGNLLNRTSPKGKVGRTKIRHVRRQGNRKEFTEVTLPEFINLLNMLGSGSGGGSGAASGPGQLSSSVANEFGDFGESALESSLQKLYGPEVVEESSSDEFGAEAFDDLESYGDDGESFESSGNWYDEYAYSEDEYF